MHIVTAYVLCVVLIATLVRSTLGFGEALIAVPLLALRIPVTTAAPLAVLISITIAGIVVMQDHEKIHLYSAGWLVVSTVLGLPFGLLLLTHGNQRMLKSGLAVLILLFSAYSLLGRRLPELKSDSRMCLFLCGFSAGVLGGAYGTNGPALVAYGTMRRWTAQHFRATLQAYFLPASILGMTGYWLSGLWLPAVTHYYLLSLPVVLPAIFLGRLLNRRMTGERYMKYVYTGLAATGILLLMQAR